MFSLWREPCRDHLNNNYLTLYIANKVFRLYLLGLCQTSTSQLWFHRPAPYLLHLLLECISPSPSKQNWKQKLNCGLHSEIVPYNFCLSGPSVLTFIMLFLLDSIHLEACSCILINSLNHDNKNLKMWIVDVLSHWVIYWKRDMY